MFCFVCWAWQAQCWSSVKNVWVVKQSRWSYYEIWLWNNINYPCSLYLAGRAWFHSHFRIFCFLVTLLLNLHNPENSLNPVTSPQFPLTPSPITCLWAQSLSNQASVVCILILLSFPMTFADIIKTSLPKRSSKKIKNIYKKIKKINLYRVRLAKQHHLGKMPL